MSTNHVGILFDSRFDNTGDAAMGIVMAKFCEQHDIDFDIVDPLNFNPASYALMIIGGGYLIRDPGDEYYDMFRVNGRHIWNAIGVNSQLNLDHLRDYRYISVRSQKEKEQLRGLVQGVKVVPCITTLMQGEPLPEGITVPDGTIAVHLRPRVVNETNIESLIEELPNHVVMMPFTHYLEDKSFMEGLAWERRDIEFLPKLSPGQLFTYIGNCKYVISSSLHASIFAMMQNVPFFVYAEEKTQNYFTDRGLEWHLFKTCEELKRKIKQLEKGKVIDFSAIIKADTAATRRHLDRLKTAIEQALVEQGQSAPSQIIPANKAVFEKLHIKLLTNVIKHRDAVIFTKSKKLHQQARSIVDLENKVKALQNEVRAIKSSKKWLLAQSVVRLAKSLKPFK